MRFSLVQSGKFKGNEVIVIPVFDGQKNQTNYPVVELFFQENPKFGKTYDTQLLFEKDQKILLVGLGKSEDLKYETIQNLSGVAVKQLRLKNKSLSILISQAFLQIINPNEVLEALVIGAEIANHDIAKSYKSDHEEGKLNTLDFVLETVERSYKDSLNKGQIIAESINLTRQLGDMPPNEMTPTYFLETARKLNKENKFKIYVLDERQSKRKGMGAFAGVSQGSDEPSYMIAIEYIGNERSKEKWGLVGKGITFDTGGISIKPSSGMNEMKYDMLGAATVLGTILAISKLNLKANVVAVMAVTENMPSGKSQRPGDIVKTYSGKTAEILNTDAEGRLVLVDALTYAQRDFKATKLIDLATLTGAMIVALGDFYTGVFSNNPKFAQDLIATGESVGEKFWELPMSPEYDEMIKSDFADISNIGHGGSMPSAAGSITAAKFLEAVIENKRPWVHLDIAGTGWDMKPKPFRGVGATGVGVKTLVKMVGDNNLK